MPPEDPKHAEPTPPFPEQEQEPPGREAAIQPLADHGETSYVGHSWYDHGVAAGRGVAPRRRGPERPSVAASAVIRVSRGHGQEHVERCLTRTSSRVSTGIEDAYTNWYLIEHERRLTIVDTGLPASWASLRCRAPRA